MPAHEHNDVCRAEVFSLWDRFFEPIQRTIHEQPRNPLLQANLADYFDLLVVPRIRCPFLAEWFSVYLRGPFFDPRVPLARNEVGLVFLAQSVSDWFDRGWLTTRWETEGRPRLRAIARTQAGLRR